MLSGVNNQAPFWTMMLFMIWIVLTITFMSFGITVALLSGSFIAGILGLFLVYMGLVSWKWVLGLFALCIAVIIFDTINQRKEN